MKKNQKLVSLYEVRLIIGAYTRKEIKINKHEKSHMVSNFEYDTLLRKIRKSIGDKKIQNFDEYIIAIKHINLN